VPEVQPCGTGTRRGGTSCHDAAESVRSALAQVGVWGAVGVACGVRRQRLAPWRVRFAAAASPPANVRGWVEEDGPRDCWPLPQRPPLVY